MTSSARRVGDNLWIAGGFEYRITMDPVGPCAECGGYVTGSQFCYTRSDGYDIEIICWECGNNVTCFDVEEADGDNLYGG